MRALENFQEVPSALEQGWKMVDGVLEPCWCLRDILPNVLVDLLDTEQDENKDEPGCLINDDTDDDMPIE